MLSPRTPLRQLCNVPRVLVENSHNASAMPAMATVIPPLIKNKAVGGGERVEFSTGRPANVVEPAQGCTASGK